MDENALRRRSTSGILLGAGDVLLLAAVSTTATLSMHWVHRLGLNIVISVVVGMFIGMSIQMLLALAASPILGSRESMLPSMVVAMVSPMVVCIVSLMGRHAMPSELIAIGLLLGTGAYPIARWSGCYRPRACHPAPSVGEGPHGDHPPDGEE